MAKFVKKMARRPLPTAGQTAAPPSCARSVVVYANYAPFKRGERFGAPRVESRMLVWSKSGRGRIVVNRQAFDVLPEDFLFLPWGHTIRYEADARTPFMLGGVHLIPDHATGVPVVFRAAHGIDDPLAGSPHRHDLAWAGIEGIFRGSFADHPSLAHLAEYTVERFRRGDYTEREARWGGRLLATEIAACARSGARAALPAELERIVRFARTRLDEPIGPADFARTSSLSLSTVGRLFRQYFSLSPVRWLFRERAARARTLLSTTNMPVAVVGAAVGIPDPYYFSKCFRRESGVPPARYRRLHAGL